MNQIEELAEGSPPLRQPVRRCKTIAIANIDRIRRTEELAKWNCRSRAYLIEKCSGIVDEGVRATENIESDICIDWMRGKRMLGSKAEADDLKIGDNRSYSMRIPGTLKVMNSRNAKEGLVHKVNNSCRPNCIIKWLDSRFWLISTECIAKGAEITVSYRLTWCNTNSPRFCFCKSIECIGMLEDAYELIAFRKSLNGINQDSTNFLPISSTTCPEFTAVPEVSPSSTNIQELAETHSREDFDDGNSLTVDPAAADDVDHEFDNDFDYSFTRNDTETMIEISNAEIPQLPKKWEKFEVHGYETKKGSNLWNRKNFERIFNVLLQVKDKTKYYSICPFCPFKCQQDVEWKKFFKIHLTDGHCSGKNLQRKECMKCGCPLPNNCQEIVDHQKRCHKVRYQIGTLKLLALFNEQESATKVFEYYFNEVLSNID